MKRIMSKTTQIQQPKYVKPEQWIKKQKQKEGKYGVMYSKNYNWNLQRFLKETYGEDFYKQNTLPQRRSTQSHTEFIDIDKAIQLTKTSMPPTYNGFNREHIAEFLKELKNTAPNTIISLGREGSPVIYLYTPDNKTKKIKKAINQTLGIWYKEKTDKVTGREYTIDGNSKPDEYREYKQNDEKPFKTNKGKLIRMWWD